MATSRKINALTFAAVMAVGLALGNGMAARAADDGYAPLWEGLGASLGVGAPDDTTIDYRERAKLVLPKSKDLPPPVDASTANPAWPNDPDVAAAKQAKIDAHKPVFQGWGGGSRHLPVVNVTGPVTIGASAGQGVPKKPCNLADGTGACGGANPQGHSFWNNLGFDTAKLGPEPDREWLTDPPRGLRAPVGPVPSPTPTPHN